MVDIGIASASSGTDAVSRLRSGRSSNTDDGSGGFLNALTSSGSGQNAATTDPRDDDVTTDQKPQPAKAGTASTDASPAGSNAPASTSPTNPGAMAKPAQADSAQSTIEVSQTTDATVADAMATLGLNTDADAAAQAAASKIPVSKPTGPQLASTLAAIQQPSTTATGTATTETPAVQQPTSDAEETPVATQTPADMMQQLAQAVASDSAAPQPANATPSPATANGKGQTGKAADDGEKDTATDGDVSAAAPGAPSGAVADTLSLLNALVAPAAQAQVAPAAVAAGAAQAGGASGKDQLSGGLQVATAAAADSDASTPEPVSLPSSTAATVAGLVSAGSGSGNGTASSDDSSTDTFRIARATGKAQAIDLSISKGADDTTQIDVKSANAAGTGAETVTVLDSRRYLGLADGSNSALVASTLSGDKGWASAMRAGASASATAAVSGTSKVVNTLKIQMNPEKLGTVTATMRLSGDALSVDLKVQSAEAYRQLSSDQSSMVDSLRSQGYQVDKITVTYAPQQSADNSSQQNSQSGFQGQQQSGASQGQGGEAQARRQNSGQQTNDQNGIWSGQTGGADDSLAGNAQRTGSAGVYL